MRLGWLGGLVILTLALLAAPLAAEAQPAGKGFRVGVLIHGVPRDWSDSVAALRERLRELGYVEGANVAFEMRWSEGKRDELPQLATDLVHARVDLIVTMTTPAALAATKATSMIPIVMCGVAQPVELGLVQSLAHPGGNATGNTNNPGPEFAVKQLQLLKEAAPKISRVAVLHQVVNLGANSRDAEAIALAAMGSAAPAIGVTLIPIKVSGTTAFPVGELTQARPDAVFVFPNIENTTIHSDAIRTFTTANRLPTLHGEKDAVRNGGLLSYSTDWLELRRRGAVYVDKILKGAKPADLPVEQPTKFELVVNLKTAKALGLTIPPSVLARADEVIQ
jgi:putative ABC transport system substrate-binding protein